MQQPSTFGNKSQLVRKPMTHSLSLCFCVCLSLLLSVPHSSNPNQKNHKQFEKLKLRILITTTTALFARKIAPNLTTIAHNFLANLLLVARDFARRESQRETLFLLLRQILRSPNRHPQTHIRIHVPRPDVETSGLTPVLAGIRVLLCSAFVNFPCLNLRSSYTGCASSIHVLKWDVTSNQGFGRARLPIPSLKLRFSFSIICCVHPSSYSRTSKENVT
jgi:hypothetical protein